MAAFHTQPIQSHGQSEPQEIESTIIVEEEKLPGYLPERFYPVCIGDVYKSRYKVITKLGYGTASTAWLCRDISENRYLTLKVHVRTKRKVPEIEISKHLNTINDHVGAKFVRIVTDSFEISGQHGVYPCLLYPPAGTDLDEVMHMYDDKMFDEQLLKAAVRDILVGMDFLHRADVIHTDIYPSNILLGIGEESTLSDLEQAENSHPSARKTLADRTIYLSRYVPVTYGRPLIADLGEACVSREKQYGLVMPDLYRAPEISLNMGWDNKIDIWAIGQTVWTLLHGSHLFQCRDSPNHTDRAHRFAEMISILGPPPPEFLKRSQETLRYWDAEGNWKDVVPIPECTLESRETRLEGKDKAIFLQFIRRALQWLPEDRLTAEELIFDDWVRGDLY